MALLNSLLFVLFLIFLIPEPCHTTSQTDFTITDLDSSDSSAFTTEANNWLYKSAICPLCIFSMPSGSSCDALPDGQMIYAWTNTPATTSASSAALKRVYATSGEWKYLPYEFDIWAFATSELVGASSLYSSGVFSIQFGTHSPAPTMKLISSCATDFVNTKGTRIRFVYKFHVQDIMTLPSPLNPLDISVTISYFASAAIDSLGLRNLKIWNLESNPGSITITDSFPCNTGYFWNGTRCQACNISCQSCSSANQCTTCKSNYYDYGNGICSSKACSGSLQLVSGSKTCTKKCSTGFYWARNQSCVETCEGPLVQASDSNGIVVCSSPCDDSSQFVYPDGSCEATCNPLLKESLESTIKFCLNPCQTPGTGTSPLFLYPDGSCVDTCPTYLNPKTEKNVTYCENTCSTFVYPNGDCLLTCAFPLTENTEYTISSCSSHCGSSTEYLYLNGSCDKKCPSPFSAKTESGIQYCENLCFDSQTFLYEDGTCQETCASPSIAKDDPLTGKTCKFPCTNKKYYYNTQTLKCTKTCDYPSEAIESPLPKLCQSSLTEEEAKQVQEAADMANSANTATSTGTMIWSIISSSDSTAAFLGPLAKMLQYIKYMDIMFPENVLVLMDSQSEVSEGFSTKMMKNVLERFPRHELPRKFETYETTSSFFVNFWPALFNLIIILLVTVLVVVGEAKTKGYAKVNGIFKSLMEVLKWNVFLITFCGSVGDIVLYTALEFQTVDFDSFAAVFSFLLCLGINTLAVMIVMKILDVNSSIRKSKKKTKDEEEHKKIIEQEWSHYKALFECYKDYSFYQQVFLFVFLVRLALFNAMIRYLYNYPLLQAVISVVSNILMLAYLVIKRPMKKMVNLIQQIVLELVLLPFNFCVLVLAIMDNQEMVQADHRKSIGNVIVYINVVVPILSLVLMGAKAIVMGADFYKSWKSAKANKIKKLASVQSGFRSNDLLNTTGEKFSVADQSSTISTTEHHLVGNQIIRPLRSDFMVNNFNYYHQNSIPMTMSQNSMIPGSQNNFQQQYQQQPQFLMNIVQEGDQSFQNESQGMMPRVQRRKINKRRDRMGIQNVQSDMRFGQME